MQVKTGQGNPRFGAAGYSTATVYLDAAGNLFIASSVNTGYQLGIAGTTTPSGFTLLPPSFYATSGKTATCVVGASSSLTCSINGDPTITSRNAPGNPGDSSYNLYFGTTTNGVPASLTLTNSDCPCF